MIYQKQQIAHQKRTKLTPRLFALIWLTLLAFSNLQLVAQTTIFTGPSMPIVHQNTDVLTTDNYNVDVSNCTSISFSVDYSASLPWEGAGNMETCDECGFGTCPCDFDMPNNFTCFNCWDLFAAKLFLDGTEVAFDIVGETGTTDAEQSGTINLGPICTNGAASLDANIYTQTWGSNESFTYTNLAIVCWQGMPTATTDAPVCAGNPVNLTGSAVNDSDVSSWMWSNSGTGTISAPSSQNTTASGPSNGETYTLTTTDTNGCTAQDDEVITILPSADAGTPTPMPSVCNTDPNSVDLFNLLIGEDAGGVWTETSGVPSSGGAFNAAVGTFSPNGQSSGTYTFQYMLSGTPPCPGDMETVTITVTAAPSANAGMDITACSTNSGPLSLSGMLIGPAGSTVLWTTTGSGSFSNPTNVNSQYTPSASDISSGSVTLTLTPSDGANCSGEASSLTLAFVDPPLVNSGGPYNVCGTAGVMVPVAGTVMNGNSIMWSNVAPGDGSFTNPGLLSTNYIPGPNDLANGSVTIELFTDHSLGICPTVSDVTTINFDSPPTGSLSGPPSLCLGQSGAFSFAATSAVGAISWSTSGDGVFTTISGSNTNYEPGAGDATAGTVVITATVNSSNSCPSETFSIVVAITPAPFISGNVPSQICAGDPIPLELLSTGGFGFITWDIPAGDGTLLNGNSPNATYIPGPNDLLNGTLAVQVQNQDLPCVNYMDSYFITIDSSPDLIIDLSPMTICGAGNVSIVGTPLNANFTSVNWTSTGTGTFTSNSALITSYNVTTADVVSGSVDIAAEVTGTNPNCGSANITTTLFVVEEPSVTVSHLATCGAGPIDITAALGGSATNGLWISTGSGNFFHPNNLNNQYTPSAADMAAGTVIISFQTDSPSPDCPTGSDVMLVTFIEQATIDLGVPYAVCENEIVNITATTTGVVGPITWLSSGDGVFTSTIGNNASYQLGPNDMLNGSVILTSTGAPATAPCVTPTSDITIDINAPPNAGTANTINQYCNSPGQSITLFDLIIGEDPGGIWAETSGTATPTGSFSAAAGNVNTLSIPSGTYTFEYTVTGTAPCGNDVETVNIEISSPPEATVTNSATICNLSAQGSIVNFNTLITSGDATGSWNDDSGSGVNLTNLSAVDFNGILDNNYSFTYTTNSATGSCSESNYVTIITVQDCSCPSVATSPFAPLCNEVSTQIDLTTITTTAESGSWAMTNPIPGLGTPVVSGNSVTVNESTNQGMYELTFTLDAAPLVGCPDSSVQILEIYEFHSAGIPDPQHVICESTNETIDLYSLITDEDLGGVWAEISVIPSTGGAFNSGNGSFNTTTQIGGPFIFTYTHEVNGPCTAQSSTVSILIESEPSATVQTTASVCNSNQGNTILDFNSFVTAASALGSWNEVSGSGVDLSDLSNVDFDGITPDTYEFEYTILATSICNNAIYSIEITVDDCACPSVVTDPIPALCSLPGMLDLSSFVPSTTDAGTWSLTDPTTGILPTISGNILSSNSALEGNYELTYSLNTTPPAGCPSFSTQTFLLVENLETGSQAQNLIICESITSVISLFGELTGADAGGTWTEESSPVSTSGSFNSATGTFDPIGQNTGTYLFRYTQNQSGPCAENSAIVTIIIEAPEIATVQSAATVCSSGGLSTMNFNSLVTSGSLSGIWSDLNGAGVNLTDLNAVEFSGVLDNSYTFNYQLTSANSCPDQTYQTIITVQDCSCPSVALAPFTVLCSNSPSIDLSDYLITTEPGFWTLLTPGGIIAPTLVGNQFDPTGASAGNYELTFTLSTPPPPDCPSFSSQNILIDSYEAATVIATSSVCNVSAEGSELNFTSFITSGFTGGVWSDLSGSGVDLTDLSSVNFDGISAAPYTFVYSIDNEGVCDDFSATIVINVDDCGGCPSVALSPFPIVCNMDAALDLSAYQTGSEPGLWTIVAGGVPSPPSITGTSLQITGATPGTYTLTFTLLTQPPPGCPPGADQSIIIEGYESAVLTPVTLTCNTSANGSIVDFQNIITSGTSTGTWVDLDGSGVSLLDLNAVDFDGVPVGDYNFEYTILNGACAPYTETIMIMVDNCLGCPPIELAPIPDICNNQSPLDLNGYVTNAGAGTWSVTNSFGATNPATIGGAILNINDVSPGEYMVTYTLSVAPPPGCLQAVGQSITINDWSDSGMSQGSISHCSNSTTTYSLFGYLIGAELGGIWSETSAVPSTNGAFDSSAGSFNPSGQIASTYTFVYSFDNEEPCQDNSSIVEIIISAPPFATIVSNTEICNSSQAGSIVNFNNLITDGDATGSWVDVEGSGVDLTDLSAVDFDGIAIGMYEYQYITNSAVPPCSEQSYNAFINVVPCVGCPSVELSPFTPICSAEGQLELNDFLVTTETGSWSLVTPTAGLSITGSVLNFDLTFSGMVELTFTLDDTVPIGCPNGASQFLNILSTPPDVHITASYCTGESLILDNGDIYNEITPSGTSVLTSSSGCDSTIKVDLTYVEELTVSVVGPDQICSGDEFELTFNFSSNGSFDLMYTVGGQLFNLDNIQNGHQETISLTQSGAVEILDANLIGNSCPITFPLNNLSIEVYDVDVQLTLSEYNGYNISCNGLSDAQAELIATGGLNSYSYDWGVSTPDLTALSAGNYNLTVVDDLGCTESLSFEITEPDPIEFDFSVEGEQCADQGNGAIVIEAIMGTGDYSYLLDQGVSTTINSFPTEITGLGGGQYSLAIVDENNCRNEMEIVVPSAENINLGYDESETIHLGDSILLLPFPNFTPASISWSPPTELSCTDCLQPWASPMATTTYEVEMVNEVGCRVSGIVVLEVDRPQVYIPNVFSPNDDGDNDIFFIQSTASEVRVKKIVIADRWGEVVFLRNNFKPNDSNFGWDGVHKGKKMNPGVFVFYAEIEYADGQVVPIKGDLTLLR